MPTDDFCFFKCSKFNHKVWVDLLHNPKPSLPIYTFVEKDLGLHLKDFVVLQSTNINLLRLETIFNKTFHQPSQKLQNL